MFAQLLMSTKSIQMTWLNDLLKKGTNKNQLKPNRKSRQSGEFNSNVVQKNVTPFSMTYGPTLPNMREIVNKHWHMLNIRSTFRNVSKATPVIAFHKNTSLSQIIGTNTISHNQKLLKVKQNVTKVECIPWNVS